MYGFAILISLLLISCETQQSLAVFDLILFYF